MTTIPVSEFRLRRYPPFGGYILVLFPSFFLFAIGGAILSNLLLRGLQWLGFPFFPMLPTFFLAYYLQPPCEVRTDETGITVHTLRHSVGLRAGEQYWPWPHLSHYQLTSNRGIFLRLQFGPEEVIFVGNGAYPLRTFLKTHFPEREKKGFWG